MYNECSRACVTQLTTFEQARCGVHATWVKSYKVRHVFTKTALLQQRFFLSVIANRASRKLLHILNDCLLGKSVWVYVCSVIGD